MVFGVVMNDGYVPALVLIGFVALCAFATHWWQIYLHRNDPPVPPPPHCCECTRRKLEYNERELEFQENMGLE